MFEIVTVIVFLWLMVKAVGLALRLTWGVAKIVASVLMGIAFPVLILCVIFASGVALLVPIVIIGIAVAILKVCF